MINIDEMKAGRELDGLIAEKVIGLRREPNEHVDHFLDENNLPFLCKEYSTNIAAAFEVQKEIERRGLQEKFISALVASNPNNAYLIADKWWLVNAPPDARCRAALESVSE